MDGPTEIPSPPPLQRHLQLESDHFCFGCGYNLHGQVVTMDERLGFLVCRCPECGRFHPAAMGVSATRPWMARLGVMLIATWVMSFLLFMGLGGFFVGLFTYIHLDDYTMYAGQNQYTNIQVRTVRPAPVRSANDYSYYNRRENDWKIFSFFTGALGVMMGMFTSIVMWHASRRVLRGTLLYPVFVAVVVYICWWLSYDVSNIIGWSILRIALYTALTIATMALGQWFGRPVARFAVRMVAPPKLRQHAQFLWLCDGLEPPKVTA